MLRSYEKSVFNLNAEYEATLSDQRKKLWEANSLDEMRAKIRDAIDVSVSEKPPESTSVGRVPRDGYSIEKMVLQRSSGVPLPFWFTTRPHQTESDAFAFTKTAKQGRQGRPSNL